RAGVSGERSFREVLGSVRESALGAYANEEVPFERLLEELNVVRDPSRTPLFQVMCVLQNAPGRELALPGVEVEEFEIEVETADCDLDFGFAEREGGLRGELTYGSDLFEPATAERMVAHLEALLRAVAGAPERPVREHSLLREAERERLAAWNATEAACELRPVQRLFEEQAAQTPEAEAVVCGPERLSYGELNRR